MKLILKKLIIENFKGTQYREIEFNHDVTNVIGANGKGKTTLFDAVWYLLFGKDSQGMTDFEIKPIDKNNEYKHKLTTAVEGHFDCEGITRIFRKEYTERWQRERSSEEENMTGHETAFFVDTVPVKKSDFEAVIDKIIPENTFKLITNPFYFSNMKREDKRRIVLEVSGEPSYEEIAGGVKKFEAMIEALEGRDIDTFKKMINSKIKDIKDKKKEIEPAIKENQRSLMTFPDPDELHKYEADMASIDTEIEVINEKIANKQKAVGSKMSEYEDLQVKKMALLKEIDSAKSLFIAELNKQFVAAQNEVYVCEADVRAVNRAMNDLNDQLKDIDKKIATKNTAIETLRKDWKDANAKEFIIETDYLRCKFCGAELQGADANIENQKVKFAEIKANELNEINKSGKLLSDELKKLKSEKAEVLLKIENLTATNINEEKLFSLREKRDKLKDDLNNIEYSEEIKEKEKTIAQLNSELEKFQILKTDNDEYKERLSELGSKRDECLLLIQKINDIKTIEARIKELEQQDNTYAAEIAKLQKQDLIVDHFLKRKIEMMDDRITRKFNGVKFKMYNKLINGNEEPTCEILINGVPFSSANNGGKINTGIKIINAFCNHYGVNAPMFIDNAEGLTNIEKSDSQMINLIVPQPKYDNPINL